MDIKLSNLNHISKNLVKTAYTVYNSLEMEDKNKLNKIVDNIIKIVDSDIDITKLKKDMLINDNINININISVPFYILISSTLVDMMKEIIPSIDVSPKIRSKMNCLDIYCLSYKNYKVKIKIYRMQDIDMMENIRLIMIRLYNLFLLYHDDMNKMDEYIYTFYLYNNVRRANINKNGKEYLKKLHNSSMRTFNTSSGMTNTKLKILIVSRIEDCLGLLTHEVLHASNKYNFDSDITIHGIEINITEAFVNMLASVINAYLTCYENRDTCIKQYIMVELIHSIIHCIKLSKISGYSLSVLLDPTQDINWYQDAYIYEYIIGKMLLFLNFKKNIKCINNREYFILLYYKHNNMINRLYKLYNMSQGKETQSASISKEILNNNMTYHAIDSMIIFHDRYDTYYNMYKKYKYKYLSLRNHKLEKLYETSQADA